MRVESEGRLYRIETECVERLVQAICSGLGVADFEVSWSFVSAEEMAGINSEFRDKPSSTDVLSFPQQEWQQPKIFSRPTWPLRPHENKDPNEPPKLLGDVLISPDDALRNAEAIGHGLDRETAFLFVHGILHLCGHDHMEPDEEAFMLKQQRASMDFLETATDRPLWVDCIQVEA